MILDRTFARSKESYEQNSLNMNDMLFDNVAFLGLLSSIL